MAYQSINPYDGKILKTFKDNLLAFIGAP